MAPIADLRCAEGRIKLGGMRRHRVVKGPHDHSLTDVARGAGNRLLLILRVIVEIGYLNRLLYPSARDFLDQCRLLVLQWRMTVQTDPDIAVPLPVGLKEWVLVGPCVDAGLPFLIDLTVTGSTGFGPQTVNPLRSLLVGNGFGIIGPETKNDDRLDLRIVEIAQCSSSHC